MQQLYPIFIIQTRLCYKFGPFCECSNSEGVLRVLWFVPEGLCKIELEIDILQNYFYSVSERWMR